MRLRAFAFVTVVALSLSSTGCKSSSAPASGPSVMPPSPAAIINNAREQLAPFRFTLATDPASPGDNSPILLKVHVIDAANQPADGVTLKADVSMSGMDEGAQHLTLSGKGGGDYEATVNLEMAGSWDVDLTATRDGKSRQQRFSIEVGS